MDFVHTRLSFVAECGPSPSSPEIPSSTPPHTTASPTSPSPTGGVPTTIIAGISLYSDSFSDHQCVVLNNDTKSNSVSDNSVLDHSVLYKMTCYLTSVSCTCAARGSDIIHYNYHCYCDHRQTKEQR